MILDINIIECINFSIIFCFLGIWGIILNKRNIIIILMSIEIILLSINLNFIFFSIYLDNLLLHTYIVFILTVAATESAIALSILISFYRITKQIEVEKISLIKN